MKKGEKLRVIFMALLEEVRDGSTEILDRILSSNRVTDGMKLKLLAVVAVFAKVKDDPEYIAEIELRTPVIYTVDAPRVCDEAPKTIQMTDLSTWWNPSSGTTPYQAGVLWLGDAAYEGVWGPDAKGGWSMNGEACS